MSCLEMEEHYISGTGSCKDYCPLNHSDQINRPMYAVSIMTVKNNHGFYTLNGKLETQCLVVMFFYGINTKHIPILTVA